MSKRILPVIASGLALFSMFFGAGNMIFPLILGESTGEMAPLAVLGMFVTAVIFPLVGLFSIMLFAGSYTRFFGRLGKWTGFLALFVVQAVLGPMGSIPRLITLSHATIKPYFPHLSLIIFSLLACGFLLVLNLKKNRIIDLLGYVLTPILLVSLGCLFFFGFVDHPHPVASTLGAAHSFFDGLKTGYSTLDLIASFLFGSLIYRHFERRSKGLEPKKARKVIIKQFLQASGIAAGLLGLCYGGLALVSSYYAPHLVGVTSPEELLGAIAIHLLGPHGSLVASIAIAMACLTTAVSLIAIASDYIRYDLFKGKTGPLLPTVITLVISGGLANLGFVGIANMLNPILQIMYPGLIVLAVVNIVHKLRQKDPFDALEQPAQPPANEQVIS